MKSIILCDLNWHLFCVVIVSLALIFCGSVAQFGPLGFYWICHIYILIPSFSFVKFSGFTFSISLEDFVRWCQGRSKKIQNVLTHPKMMHSLGTNAEWKLWGSWLTVVHWKKWLIRTVCVCVCVFRITCSTRILHVFYNLYLFPFFIIIVNQVFQVMCMLACIILICC